MKLISIMGSGSLGNEIDLNTLVDNLERVYGGDLDANFQSDGMVTVKFRKNGAAYSIYRTGTFQIRGALSHEELIDSLDGFIEALSKIGFETGEVEFEVKTAVFMDEVNKKLDLEQLSIHLGLENIEYEPEQFPGLVYRQPGLDATLLIFSSGKVLVVGTSEEAIAQRTLQNFSDTLKTVPNIDHRE